MGDRGNKMNFDRKELGRRIAKRRKEKKIFQYKLAEGIGVNATHLSSIEAGRVTPSLEVLVKICDTLEVTPDYLLEGTMHSSNVPKQIEEHLRLCREEDIELVAEIVKFLADRNEVK